MFIPPSSDGLISQVVNINRGDRWTVYRRLKELKILCWCPNDGSLWVKIDHAIDGILLRSTVQHSVANRQELVDWLDRCYSAPLTQTFNYQR